MSNSFRFRSPSEGIWGLGLHALVAYHQLARGQFSFLLFRKRLQDTVEESLIALLKPLNLFLYLLQPFLD